MRLDEATWPVLDELVERLVEDRSVDTRRRYGRAAAHLLAVLTSDDLPGDLDADTVRAAAPRLVEPDRLPRSAGVGRTYLVLVTRLVEHLGGDADALSESRRRFEADLSNRPLDPRAQRIPARLLESVPSD